MTKSKLNLISWSISRLGSNSLISHPERFRRRSGFLWLCQTLGVFPSWMCVDDRRSSVPLTSRECFEWSTDSYQKQLFWLWNKRASSSPSRLLPISSNDWLGKCLWCRNKIIRSISSLLLCSFSLWVYRLRAEISLPWNGPETGVDETSSRLADHKTWRLWYCTNGSAIWTATVVHGTRLHACLSYMQDERGQYVFAGVSHDKSPLLILILCLTTLFRRHFLHALTCK